MDTQTRDAVRIALVKAFRAARARGRHDGMREARKREWMTHPDSDFVQVAKRGKYKKHLGHFRGNPMLHKREREQLCELHAYFSRYRTAIRNAMDSTTPTLSSPSSTPRSNTRGGRIRILLHSQCMQNVFGAPGEYSAYSIHN
ncbi:uncharacterized protein B0H18DRAFT_1120766 [Fomitopsis serialis]|uniref:uncharacterized protein n=1 Tax=Fomitopsis serialis TaxID=139415 RepID=UPI0020078295|nr:uncharacterized protein B0H18DRAFT_1120766 [Neoantrodia serialis]KAH9922769.1 hypothetical protein B0H18DRAFT_1120766 [Neoantrodia serialis]